MGCCYAMQAFAKGPGPFFGHLTDPDFLHAVRLAARRPGMLLT